MIDILFDNAELGVFRGFELLEVADTGGVRDRGKLFPVAGVTAGNGVLWLLEGEAFGANGVL